MNLSFLLSSNMFIGEVYLRFPEHDWEVTSARSKPKAMVLFSYLASANAISHVSIFSEALSARAEEQVLVI